MKNPSTSAWHTHLYINKPLIADLFVIGMQSCPNNATYYWDVYVGVALVADLFHNFIPN